MKRIVICCDGTWNTPDETRAGLPRPTNVVKLAEAVQPESGGVRQLLYYDAGIGSAGNPVSRAYDGATGAGLSAKLREAYRYLVTSYEVGDEIFLFGFSRGAFTVRSLAGLIRNSGVLGADDPRLLEQAFRLYRARGPATHPREREATLFRRTHAVADTTPIKLIGVWDTVGTLGNPLLVNGVLSRRNAFHDTALSSWVQRAYQALAIDEKRLHFPPTLWRKQAHAIGQVLEQVWFAGTHSDVGGGHADTGLSDLALCWMAEKAAAAGLALGPIRAFPDPTAPLTESRTGVYRALPPYARPLGVPGVPPSCESLHPSVIERYRKDAGYRPANLDDFFLRNPAQRPESARKRERHVAIA